MRRQTTGGVKPAGSSRLERLDPLSLPASFETRDIRADGGVRRVELDRDRVTLRRAVHGMRMAIKLRISDFLGVTLLTIEGAPTLILKHRDPSLSVPLAVCDDESIAIEWERWSETLSLPQISDRAVQSTAEPAPRRRRRNAIKRRRPSILLRRRMGRPIDTMSVHHGEREIIARN